MPQSYKRKHKRAIMIIPTSFQKGYPAGQFLLTAVSALCYKC